MDAYIDKLIENFYNIYKYNIIEIEEVTGLATTWGLANIKNDVTEVIFFSYLKDYRTVNINEIVLKLRKLLGCSNVNPIQIVIDDKVDVYMNEDNNPQLSHEIYPQCELIFINNVNKKIVYYTETTRDTAEKIANSMQYIGVERTDSSKTQKPIITYIFIAVNVLIYIVTAYLSASISDSNSNVLVFMGAKVNSLINKGEYYRLFTCMFLHGGIVHLGLNMYGLYALGSLIERVYGKFKYTIIYILSGLVSSLFSYKFSVGISVGASGAIFGLLGAALVFGIRMRQQIGRDFIMNIVSVIAVNLVIGFSISNIDNFGHLGGLIGGTVFSYLGTLSKYS